MRKCHHGYVKIWKRQRVCPRCYQEASDFMNERTEEAIRIADNNANSDLLQHRTATFHLDGGTLRHE